MLAKVNPIVFILGCTCNTELPDTSRLHFSVHLFCPAFIGQWAGRTGMKDPCYSCTKVCTCCIGLVFGKAANADYKFRFETFDTASQVLGAHLQRSLALAARVLVTS